MGNQANTPQKGNKGVETTFFSDTGWVEKGGPPEVQIALATFGILALELAIMEAGGGVSGSAVYYGLLAIGGLGLVLGISTWGHRVMETIGKKITDITPISGFAATFSTATITLVCTRFGYPTSVSQVMVGAIVGIGLAGGIRALDVKVIRNIAVSWIITVPISAGLAAAMYVALLGVV